MEGVRLDRIETARLVLRRASMDDLPANAIAGSAMMAEIQ